MAAGSPRASSPTGPAPDASYSVGEVAAAMDIPRSTLLYYETQGIVSPEKDGGNGYRRYNNRDLFRLADATMLKNVGIPPKDIGPYLEGDPFAPGRIDEYLVLLDRRMAYLAAERDCLERARRVRLGLGGMRTAFVERYYICHAPGQMYDLLAAHPPISSMGGVFTGDFFDVDVRPRRGRTIPARYASLIDGLETEGLAAIGGCRCLVACKFENDVHVPRAKQGSVAADMRRYLDERGLEVAGPAFTPFTLSSAEGTSMPVCLPVRETGCGEAAAAVEE